MTIEQDLAGFRKRVSTLTARQDMAREEVARLKTTVAGLNDSILTQEQVIKLLQGFADRLQGMVQEDVSQFVTEGVRAVFGQDETFKLEFGVRANQIVANMTLGGLPLSKDQSGVFMQSGGALNLVSYLLRLWTVLRLSQLVGLDRVILLDEPFGRLRGSEYKNRVADLLPRLSEQLGVQTIWVADEDFPLHGATKVYDVTVQDGGTVAHVRENCCD